MAEITYLETEKKLVCTMSGRMGTETNDQLMEELSGRIEGQKKVMPDSGALKVCFDLKEVTFIASSFIRTCIAVSRQVETGNFSIVNASPIIKKTFKIANLDELLSVK